MSLELRGIRPGADRPLDQRSREQRTVVLRTVDGMEVVGTIHLSPGLRVLDLLNRQTESFVAVTEATFTLVGRRQYVPFMAVNRAHVVSLYELPSVE